MDSFTKDLEVGEIHLRDNLQFELKSDFTPVKDVKTNTYTQEFYFFIPNSLQVNRESYTLNQFYRDQTNFIRYKTPEFSFTKLLNPKNKRSPLYRIKQGRKIEHIKYELKLLGNIVRSSLRARSSEILDNPSLEQVRKLCDDLRTLRTEFVKVDAAVLEKHKDILLKSHFFYVDEFISNSINFYLIGLLDSIRHSQLPEKELIDEEIRSLLTTEKKHREEKHLEAPATEDDAVKNEFVIYRRGLLNKFVLDSLLLSTSRLQLYNRYRHLVGAVSAGIAMLFFFVLFVWQGNVFIINSLPFILITVILYILKDRIKEGLRNISYRQFHKLYPDYNTDIRSPVDESIIGKMTESFSFISEKELPDEIKKIRNREFHAVLDQVKRPERIIFIKKTVTLFQNKKSRKHALNIIFRYNINQFLSKADNPFLTNITVDSRTGKLIREKLPKVYHLNIILKNTFLNKERLEEAELKKFRLILDKNGIKRVEHLT